MYRLYCAAGEEPQYITRDFRLTPLVAYLNSHQRTWMASQLFMETADRFVADSMWDAHMDGRVSTWYGSAQVVCMRGQAWPTRFGLHAWRAKRLAGAGRMASQQGCRLRRACGSSVPVPVMHVHQHLTPMPCLPTRIPMPQDATWRKLCFAGFREDLAHLPQDERDKRPDMWPGACPPRLYRK